MPAFDPMSKILDFLIALFRKAKPVNVDLHSAPLLVHQEVHARTLTQANALLSEAMGEAVRLVLIETEHRAWLRVVPGSTAEDADMLETPNLGSVSIHLCPDPEAALASLKASSGFKKTRISLRSRRMNRLRRAGWLKQGFYEYAFFRHVFYCATKNGNFFEAAVAVGDGLTLIPNLECRDLILDFVSLVGRAVDEAPWHACALQPSPA
jgi:hypothetical protein